MGFGHRGSDSAPWLWLVALVAAGCARSVSPDGGLDAGAPSMDVGAPDRGVDFGPPDLGVPDAGVDFGRDDGPDGGPDFGVDLGPDVGPPDLGPDAGPCFTGRPPPSCCDAPPDVELDCDVDTDPDAVGCAEGVDPLLPPGSPAVPDPVDGVYPVGCRATFPRCLPSFPMSPFTCFCEDRGGTFEWGCGV